MRFSIPSLSPLSPLLACLALAAAAASAQEEAPRPAGPRYDFAYRSSDENVHVFDDGRQTFLQLPASAARPVVLTRGPEGETLVRFAPNGIYHVAPGIHAALSLRWPNQREVSVRYIGNSGAAARAGTAVAFGPVPLQASFGLAASPVPPRQTAGSPATSIDDDASPAAPAAAAAAPVVSPPAPAVSQTTAALSPAASSSKVPVIEEAFAPLGEATAAASATLAIAARPSGKPAPAASASRGSATASLAPPSPKGPAIEEASAAQSKPAPQWRLMPADDTLSAALARWAGTAGYQVVWQAPKDLPVYSARYAGSFEAAVEQVMKDTALSAYPLHACLYDNRVVRVLHVTQSCAK